MIDLDFYSTTVRSIDDLDTGMVLNGSVTNITGFGAFVDIGVKQDGLVHISQIANEFVRSPHDHLHIGKEVKVKVLSVDKQRQRINLTMRDYDRDIAAKNRS